MPCIRTFPSLPLPSIEEAKTKERMAEMIGALVAG